MKKLLKIVFASSLLFLAACASQPTTSPESNPKHQVVVTIFPEYDWVRQLIQGKEEDYEVTLLLDNGIDLHNYQPTTDDILKISTCDLFIYVGGESDEWIDNTLRNVTNENQIVLNLLEILGNDVLEEEWKEGMLEEEEEGEEEEEEEIDEHIWFSLKHANTLCETIKDALTQIDSENASIYEENYRNYSEQLLAMHDQYAKAFSNTTKPLMLVADRFPFRYLTEEYNIDYYAAFKGCSAETEASFETIRFLTDQLQTNHLNYIFVTESSDQKIAQTIIANSQEEDVSILVLDSLQAITEQDIQNGATYLGIFEENLATLKQAFQ